MLSFGFNDVTIAAVPGFDNGALRATWSTGMENRSPTDHLVSFTSSSCHGRCHRVHALSPKKFNIDTAPPSSRASNNLNVQTYEEVRLGGVSSASCIRQQDFQFSINFLMTSMDVSSGTQTSIFLLLARARGSWAPPWYHSFSKSSPVYTYP